MNKQNQLLYFLMFLIFSFVFINIVLSNEISIEQFVYQVNEAREHIKSGELTFIMTNEYSGKNPEQIKRWIDAQLSRRKKMYPKKPVEELKQRIEIEAESLKEHKKTQEINIAFEVDDINSFHNPENYRYRQLITDKTVWNIDDPFGVFMNYQTMSYYNDGIQLIEEDFPNRLIVSIFNADRIEPKFANFHLWGRPQFRISKESVKSLKAEFVNGRKYLIGIVEIEGKTLTLWMDAEKGWIVKEEYYDTSGRRTLVIGFKDFRTFPGDIFFPTRISCRAQNNPTRRLQKTTYQIKDALFNIEFPPNYFIIDLEKIYDSGVEVKPISDIKMQREVKQRTVDIKCAPKSLLYICKIFGIDAALDELSKLCKVDPDTGTTLLNLYKAAEQKGLSPQAVKVKSMEGFRKATFPVIVHLNYDHFFVVNAIENEEVIIIDGSDKYNLPLDEFEKIWDGYVLLVNNPQKSRSDMDTQEKSIVLNPKIKFTQTRCQFKTALGGEQIKHKFHFINEGNGTLVIQKVDTPCRCTVANLEMTEIPGGQKGFIEITLNIPKANRDIDESVLVYTNDPKSPKIELKLIGKAFVPIIPKPTHIILGRKRLLQPLEAEAILHLSEKKYTKVAEIEASSPHITVLRKPAEGKEIKVNLTIAKDTPVGPFKESLKINYIYKDKKHFIEVPISGEILGDIVLSSHRFFLGIVKDSKVSKQITISEASNLPIEVVSVEADSPNLSTSILKKSQNKYELQCLLNTNLLPQGEFYASISIRTTSQKQPEIKIPVYAIIKTDK